MSTLDGGDHNAVASGGEETCRRFSLVEIRSMTNDFDDASVIGIGGFGKVYKGSIDDGATMVAIKRLKAESKQGVEEFWTEVKLLSKLQHNNLVPLIGHCNRSKEMILVYEYMAHGTLADHLYKLNRKERGDSTSNHHLTWEQRLGICIGAARGLDYLHTGTNQAFIHRDVKTTNILLDEKWVAKIADFGLTKALTSQSATHVSTNVKGTFGYFDLDYYLTGKLTMKSDVYAFGVVLLEVLCGRPPVDTTLEDEPVSLVLWAQQNIKKGKLEKIIDPFLGGQISPHCLKYFVKLANDCLQKCSNDRPTMSEVVTSLELALGSQGRGRKEGIITKMFQGMNGWWSEKKEDDGSKVELSKDPSWEPPPSGSVSPKPYRQFSLAELRASTHDFDENLVIEKGLYRKVHKGLSGKGVFDPPKLVDYVYKRTGKHALVVKQEPEKKEEVDKGKEEKKAEEGGGDKDTKKGEEEAKGGDGPAAAAAAAPAPEGGEETAQVVEVKKSEFYYNYPNYQFYPYPYAQRHELNSYTLEFFSDENPNACSVM